MSRPFVGQMKLGDTLALASLALGGITIVAHYAWRASGHAEDSAMLFRYAENVADGWGIVWNPGEQPVDGATDLLFMLAVAALRRLGAATERAALWINASCFVLAPLVVFSFGRRRGVWPAASGLAAACLLLGPGVSYVQTGYAAPTFALAAGVCAILAMRVAEAGRRTDAWMLGGAIAVAGAIRPEGFLIGGGLLLFVRIARGAAARPSLAPAVFVAVACGVAFVAWRWAYFGDPLPNAYYRKGAGRLHLDALLESLAFTLEAAWPAIVVILAGLRWKAGRRFAAASLAALGVLVGMWVLMSTEMNFAGRYQYPGVVVAVVLALGVLARLREAPAGAGPEVPVWSRAVIVAAVAAWAGYAFAGYPHVAERDPSEPVALVLAKFPGPARRVVTTEAGYVCWRSGWTCIDAWGLNDRHIAHRGFLDERAIAAIDPDVIVVHAPTSPLMTSIHAARDFLPGWSAMTDPLIRYAEGGKYTLAATFEPQRESCYATYVKNDAPDSARLIAAVRAASAPYPAYPGVLRLPTAQ